ncbi:alpha/beta fold hydrolase [Nocardioides sp. ChNu-153]|uniref:alpha/beta hydrolase n=1 Tax=unclassified Nocardioides TaxID=2615069 RepID=UPI002405FE16|nr:MULTISPECIES: alpha/beta fold hydrolase [unclassified Nocardioides]MDF9715989.1 lysophospholipase [Nocardioides sp. ChNu-99]MDN7119957.1 alpha/beta fold hydrolase [Nocardioides sp. ChNu-153]
MSSPTAPDEALTRYDVTRPRGVVLLLHGGTEQSASPVDGRSASWRRSAAMQRSITPRLAADGVATWLLRYTLRGWNGGAPVADARAALRRLDAALPDVPVVLLGHSMGGRTAVHIADHPSVVGVVGLAPWFPPGEPTAALAGKWLLAAHGSRDRITSPRATRAYVERADADGARATFRDAGPVGHYMFRRAAAWNDLAVEGCSTLLSRARR